MIRGHGTADDAGPGVHQAGAELGVGELPDCGGATLPAPREDENSDQRGAGGPEKDGPGRSGGHASRDYGTGMPDFRAENPLA